MEWQNLVTETSWWLLVVALTVFALLMVGLGVVGVAVVLGVVELIQSVGDAGALG